MWQDVLGSKQWIYDPFIIHFLTSIALSNFLYMQTHCDLLSSSARDVGCRTYGNGFECHEVREEMNHSQFIPLSYSLAPTDLETTSGLCQSLTYDNVAPGPL